MRTPSTTKQLEVLKHTIRGLGWATDERERVETIFKALLALGFTGGIRFRVGALVEGGQMLEMRYGCGEYGGLPLSSIRIDLSGSVLAHAIDLRQPVFIDTSPPAHHFYWRPISEMATIQSYVCIPIFRDQAPVGVLSLDSIQKDAFPSAISSVLEPYITLLAEALRGDSMDDSSDLVGFIRRSKEKHVLILGKDTGDELQRLLDIRTTIQADGYCGVLVKEHPDIPEMSNEEKVRSLADVCRFVILENSFPAGQIVECKICSTNRIITAALREDGQGSSFMVTDYFKDFDFMKEFTYKGTRQSLTRAVEEATRWAEGKVRDRASYYNSLYPWRSRITQETAQQEDALDKE